MRNYNSENFAVNNIAEEILKIVKKALKNQVECDRTFKGRIVEIVNPKKVKVMINGKVHTASTDKERSINEIVHVCAPCNNWNDLFIC